MDAQHMEHAHGAGCQHDHHHSGGCCGHEHCHEDGCGCGHGHGGSVEKGEIIRLAVAGALFVAALLAPLEGAWRLASFLVPYLAAGWDVLLTALKNLATLRFLFIPGRRFRPGALLDENFLMAVASIGALALGEYPEAVAVMLFYSVGELCQSYAVGKSRRSIAALMDIRPESAAVQRGGRLETVSPEAVAVGEVIYVKVGERVPLDGELLSDSATLDTSALTGESAPRTVQQGGEALSGAIVLSSPARIRVTRAYGQSTVAKILEMVEEAAEKKARPESFIRTFARVYTPLVVLAALLLGVGVPAVLGLPFGEWIQRGLTFLVISCPCALVISVPLTYFAGIGGASRRGVLIKGGSYLEALAQVDTVIFDKTGTLTKGNFAVTEVDGEKTLEYAALAEAASSHPIALSIRAAFGQEIEDARVTDIVENGGNGVEATVDGRRVRVGKADFAGVSPVQKPGTVVYVSLDGAPLGYICIADEIKPDAAAAVAALKQSGRRTVMLTGDSPETAAAVGRETGIGEAIGGLLPGDKVTQVEQRMAGGHKVAFAGDGINDAPVLSRADVGIAMGGIGSDAAIEAADVVIMDDAPARIPTAMAIARKTSRIVRENIVFALAVKALFLALGAAGLIGMWLAVFADVGVALIAVLNAIRAMR